VVGGLGRRQANKGQAQEHGIGIGLRLGSKHGRSARPHFLEFTTPRAPLTRSGPPKLGGALYLGSSEEYKMALVLIPKWKVTVRLLPLGPVPLAPQDPDPISTCKSLPLSRSIVRVRCPLSCPLSSLFILCLCFVCPLFVPRTERAERRWI